MRLTLRTLLAYLDDTLDPAQAKLIGQKVAESDAAQELIAKIKQVTRRRRLTTPPPTGAGGKVDANTVAEYLDNELSSEQLAEVEEVCLASDVHLAEMAACHQILSLVVGEPVLVPPVARQRMYRLVKGRESIPYRKPPAQPRRPADAEDARPDVPEPEETGGGGFGSWQRSPWFVPVGALVLLAASGLSLYMALRPATPPLPPGAAPSDELVATAAPRVEPRPEAGPAEKSNAKEPDQATPKADSKQPEKSDEKLEVKPDGVPSKVEPPSRIRREAGNYVTQAMAPPTVLLARSADSPEWERLRSGPEGKVHTADLLVSLPGYHSELRLDSGVHLTLWGNLPEFSRIRIPVLESAVVLNANAGADLDLTLVRGRVVFANQKAMGPAVIRARFEDEVWEITLADSTSRASLELVGICTPVTREAGSDMPQISVALLALEGEAHLKARDQQEMVVPAPSIVIWDNIGPAAPGPRRMPSAPDWWTNPTLPGTREGRALGQALEELSKRITGKTPVEVVLSEALKEPESSVRVLAARSLVAVGNIPRLLDALDDEKYPDVRVQAIEGLKHWLGLSAVHDKILMTMLVNQKQYPDRQAESVVQLLHGYSDRDAADPVLRGTLVEYLGHDRLPIRQLAHWQLSQIVPEGQKIRYDAAGVANQREQGQEQWRRLVSREVKPTTKSGVPK